MRRRDFILTLATASQTAMGLASAQSMRSYRIGVILLGGPYLTALDGLRIGLREEKLEEGRQITLHVRNVNGDLRLVEAAATTFEREAIDLIYSLATSVTLATARATKRVPLFSTRDRIR